MLALIVFHFQDQNSHPAANVQLDAASPNGDWHGMTDCAGNFIAQLTPGHYDITYSGTGYTTGVWHTDLADPGIITQEIQRSFSPAPRAYRGNMCGVRVPGLPLVPGGQPADPSLVLSWFIFKYSLEDRLRIYDAWRQRGCVDTLVSWPDSRVSGQSPQQFGQTCQELIAHGFRPMPMLCGKDQDPPDVPIILANVAPVLPFIVGLVPRVCIGWELSLWLQPEQVQQLIDAWAPLFTPIGTKVYVHFGQGVSSWQPDGHPFAYFWNANVGKLTGLYRERKFFNADGSRCTRDQYYYDSGGIVDVLIRFAGNAGVVQDCGFGHPFDLIEGEITAQDQFDGTVSEAEGNSWGSYALACPPQNGPNGVQVQVMGSGNGQE